MNCKLGWQLIATDLHVSKGLFYYGNAYVSGVYCENATTSPQTTTSRRNQDDAPSGPENVRKGLKVSSLLWQWKPIEADWFWFVVFSIAPRLVILFLSSFISLFYWLTSSMAKQAARKVNQRRLTWVSADELWWSLLISSAWSLMHYCYL
jgi:hypothetical protein